MIMSYVMAYGMEVYNVAIKMGFHLQISGLSSMTNVVFWEALKEALYMGLFVFLFSSLWGNRLGAAFAARHCDPERDNPYFCQLLRQGGTVAVMCPTMSLVASILFNIVLGGAAWTQLPAIWVGTLPKKFPHGISVEFLCRRTLSHWLFGRIFSRRR